MSDDSDTDTVCRVEATSDVDLRRLHRWSECHDDGFFVATTCPWCGAAIGPVRPQADTCEKSDVFTCYHCGRDATLWRNSDGILFCQALMSPHDLAYLAWLTAKDGRPIGWSEVTP